MIQISILFIKWHAQIDLQKKSPIKRLSYLNCNALLVKMIKKNSEEDRMMVC